MSTTYKPLGYNSASPYYIVNGAQRLIDLLKKIFPVEELRRYERPDGTIMHAEIRIDDSVLMFGDSSDRFPPNQLLIHIYVPNVDLTFKSAIEAGCLVVDVPRQHQGDPDKRGSFKDFAGNVWSIATQF